MRFSSSFVRRWLLYGVLLSFLHLCSFWFFGVIIDGGVVATNRFTDLGEWLSFPAVWFLESHVRDILHSLPPSFEPFYDQHEGFFVVSIIFGNSALWGFPIAGALL